MSDRNIEILDLELHNTVLRLNHIFVLVRLSQLAEEEGVGYEPSTSFSTCLAPRYAYTSKCKRFCFVISLLAVVCYWPMLSCFTLMCFCSRDVNWIT